MTILRLFKSRAGLLAAVFSTSLVAGAVLFLLSPTVYEVKVLMEVRGDVIGPYSSYLVNTISRTIESGVLNGKIAEKAGLQPENLPKLRAKVMFTTQLVKVYAFVPYSEIEKAKKTLSVMPGVLDEEFAERYYSHTRRVLLAVERAQHLQKVKAELDSRLKNAGLSPEMKSVSHDFTDWVRELSDMLRTYADIIKEGQTQNTFRVRMVAVPAVSSSPVGPSRAQVMIAFGLLGLFAGLSVVLWLDERESEAEKHK